MTASQSMVTDVDATAAPDVSHTLKTAPVVPTEISVTM
jgi:hypothetical protein